LKNWISATSASFDHKTLIEDHVSEGDKIILKIKMIMKHIGLWRGIEPSGAEVTATGYRFYKLKEDKIIESWALIDGQAIESQLKGAIQFCKVAV
jgi:predicted ester cyclase